MAITQDQRQIIVDSALEKDLLLFYSMHGNEELGRLYKYEIDLLSTDANINLDDVLGKQLTVKLSLGNDKTRYFNGFASSFLYMGMQGEYHLYKATVRPWLWFLTRTADCRIFQNKAVPDIIKEVFRYFGYTDFEDQLSGEYRAWEYCVQYRESAFAFVSRLMEQVGIYYYFKHEEDKHVLVLADSISAHSRVADYEQIPYYPPQQEERRESDHFNDWFVTKDIEPQKYTLSDFDFTKPRSSLEARATVEDGYADFEVYDYPGDYTELEDGQTAARTRAEQLQTKYERVHGKGNTRALSAGCLFELTNYPREDQNKEYLLVNARYFLHSDMYRTGNSQATDSGYRMVFTAMDSMHPYRPARISPQPTVQGPQTAIVVGPKDEKVWTDKYGRVKVQFHWDRYGQKDENSSCWVRVSQNWAGKNWGSLQLPHIGQEVIVDFLEGDPNRPIVTGRVYNADNMPAVDQPKNKSKSIIRDDFGNEMVFDATPGDEHIRLYSPHHNSAMEIGKSYNIWTTSDDNSGKLGNTFEWGLGTKTEIYGGLVTEVKTGLLSEVALGTMLDFKWGGEVSVSCSWESKAAKGPIHQYTAEDILSLSGQDHVVGAGKGLCIVGGSSGEKNARTIINMAPDEMSITAGSAHVRNITVPSVTYDKQLFEEYIPEDESWKKILMYTAVSAAVLGAAGGSLTSGIIHPFVGEPKEGEPMDVDWTHITSMAIGTLALLSGLFIGLPGTKKLKKMWENEKAVEPVEHTDPAAKILLKKSGEVAIESKQKEVRIKVEPSQIFVQKDWAVLKSGESELWVMKNGSIDIIGDRNITLNSKMVTAKKGFKSKNIFDAG